jgi:hypothetical protein
VTGGALTTVFVPLSVFVPLLVALLLLPPPSLPPPPPHAVRLKARESAAITPKATFSRLKRIFFFSTAGFMPFKSL